MMLGQNFPGCLGMFHYFQRIVRTLRDGHDFSVPAIRDLKQCIYEYDQQDLSNLVEALKEGRMGNRGKKYTTADINKIMYTREWKQKYDQYLKKKILPPQLIDQKLTAWMAKYKERQDMKGKNLFTPDTKKVVLECIKKAPYLQDPPGVPLEDMYRQVLPTSRMKHDLSFHLSNRGESGTESAQGQQQHFANVGMRDTIADQYILRGMCRGNARIRQRLLWNEMPQDMRERIPSLLRGEPQHFDHLLLGHINKTVKDSGSPWVPFQNLFEIKADNGEQFLSAYKKAQDRRAKTVPVNRHNSRCQCPQCAGNPVDLPWKAGGQQQPSKPVQEHAPSMQPARIPPMLGCDDDSSDDGFNLDPFSSDDDNVGIDPPPPKPSGAMYEVERDIAPYHQTKVCRFCVCVVGANKLTYCSKRARYDMEQPYPQPQMRRPFQPHRPMSSMPPSMMQQHQYQYHQQAMPQFARGNPFMPMQQPPMTPPMQSNPYYYGMDMQQSPMQQAPPMMMPPGWKHPRAPPQFDGFCCHKKEQAVRSKKVGKHPHNKDCPVRLWHKENSKSVGYYM